MKKKLKKYVKSQLNMCLTIKEFNILTSIEKLIKTN